MFAVLVAALTLFVLVLNLPKVKAYFAKTPNKLDDALPGLAEEGLQVAESLKK